MTTQDPNRSSSLPATLETILDAVQVPVPTATLRILAGVALRNREVSAQSLSRVAAYEPESFLRRGEPPRFSWVLHPNGVAASPRVWARGSWRLSRRILSEDAVPGWSVVLALFLVDQMISEDDWARNQLGRVAHEAVVRVLGPIALYPPGPREEWVQLRARLVGMQHPAGAASTTATQDAAEARLEEQGVTPYGLYFGIGETIPTRTEDLPPRLRLAHESEDGVPFDRLVMNLAAGDEDLGREVLAYIQEWGALIDQLARNPSIEEYAERWRVDLATARRRNDRFAALFPSEETPERIWNLLWSGDTEKSFIRLTGRAVIADERPPTVLNHFVRCLVHELKDEPRFAAAVEAQIATFEERSRPAGQELRRFFALCDRALRIWCPAALFSVEQPGLVQGLLSLGTIYDEDGAAFAEAQFGQYRRGLGSGPAPAMLREVQAALRIAATLDAMSPPESTGPYLEGVQRAAKALAQVRESDIGLDLMGEAAATVRALDAVH